MATFSGLPVELKLRIVKYVNEASHDPASTAKFLTSPILHAGIIDKDFWRLTLARYQDLRQVALICRDLRPLAQ
jgi:hypothetical protein